MNEFLFEANQTICLRSTVYVAEKAIDFLKQATFKNYLPKGNEYLPSKIIDFVIIYFIDFVNFL